MEEDLVGMGEWVELGSESQSNMTFTAIGETPAQTSMNETEELVTALIHADVEVILYAGGDGTTRDIANTLEKIGDKAKEIPLIGVPGGVKMHSGYFATTPSAAEVALAFMIGDLRCAITEVMDLDEEIYQEGFGKYECTVKLGLLQPSIYAKGSQEQVERTSEADTIEGLAQHIEIAPLLR